MVHDIEVFEILFQSRLFPHGNTMRSFGYLVGATPGNVSIPHRVIVGDTWHDFFDSPDRVPEEPRWLRRHLAGWSDRMDEVLKGSVAHLRRLVLDSDTRRLDLSTHARPLCVGQLSPDVSRHCDHLHGSFGCAQIDSRDDPRVHEHPLGHHRIYSGNYTMQSTPSMSVYTDASNQYVPHARWSSMVGRS